MEASFSQRGLHADEEAAIGRVVGGGMRTGGSCCEGEWIINAIDFFFFCFSVFEYLNRADLYNTTV